MTYKLSLYFWGLEVRALPGQHLGKAASWLMMTTLLPCPHVVVEVGTVP